MSFTRVLAQVVVGDHDRAVAWYARLFGRAPDTTPMDGLAEWQLTGTGWLQVFSDAATAGNSTVTLGVDDLDPHLADLGDIEAARQTTSRDQQLGTVTDPDGNVIVLAQDH